MNKFTNHQTAFTGSKIPWEIAMPVAEEMVEILKPFCEEGFIKIVGSLRRLKRQVGDIEILFVPRFVERAKDMFATEPVDLAQEKINELLTSGFLAKRPSERGTFAWGEKNKLAIHVPTKIPLDLFSTTKENWFVSLVIRTGSKETNLRLTTGAQKQNATLNAYGSGVTWSDGTKMAATSERHVFELCRIPYIKPEHR